jgi:hypothetical protein
VSGPGRPYGRTHASVLAIRAPVTGVDEKRIILLETAKDTEEEAVAVAAIAGGAKTALVTSAWHMPRAAAPLPGPASTLSPAPRISRPAATAATDWSDVRIDSESLERSTLGVHE